MTETLRKLVQDYILELNAINPDKVPVFKSQLKKTTALLRDYKLKTDMSIYKSYVDTADYHSKPVVELQVPSSIERELAVIAEPVLKKHGVEFGHVFMCFVTEYARPVPRHLHLSAVTHGIDGRSNAFSIFMSTDGSPCTFEYYDKDVEADAVEHHLIVRANQSILDKYLDQCTEGYKTLLCESGDIVCFDSRKVIHSAEFKPKDENSVGIWFVFDMTKNDVELTDLVVKFHEPLLDGVAE